jgi:alkylation response protein AidB-like acyl-CoA dehydrogenase
MSRANCLSNAAMQALQAGDHATAARMTAEAQAAIKEAIEFVKRAQAQ